MAITVFVDTNIFLSLYAFSEDDLSQFRNLFVLSQEGEINFLLPNQVIDEFWRNREAKISEAIKDFREPISKSVPALARDLEEYPNFSSLMKDTTTAQKELMSAVMQKAKSLELAADKLVQEIFEKSSIIEVTDKIITAAKDRAAVGNPPGKVGSLGDAINWECILSQIEFLDDLCFVSRDRDYQSPLHGGAFNEFLSKELADLHFADVTFYPSLRAFMNDKFPDTKIEAFQEAAAAVHNLEISGSFASTHAAIAKLSAVEVFSKNQLVRLIEAAETNSQVGWIMSDADVSEFFKKLRNDYDATLSKRLMSRLDDLLSVEEASDDLPDEIPF